MPATIDVKEIEKFSALAASWWDEKGPFKPLHQLNPIRIRYIRDHICQHFGKNPEAPLPLSALTLLDIGCGGGLLSEPLSRLGATVTGIDASSKNIGIASTHAAQTGLSITYKATSAEQMVEEGQVFDVVLAMEVIEHVAEVPLFIEAIGKLVKPGGLVFIATLNRTVKSYLFAILGAEYVLRWLPRGTHEWSKFLKPSEIAAELRKQNMTLMEVKGVEFDLLSRHWKLSTKPDVNYMMVGKKG